MFAIRFDVEESVTINRSLGDVYGSVADFSTWPKWSPWLCQEPTCPVTIEGTPATVGHSQAWEGDFIGSGKMHITNAAPDERLDYDMMFLKPWKSRSKVGFRFIRSGDCTEVRWWMRGSVPIFMFFLKRMMAVMVGSDYRRGLSMLKEYLETGSVPSATTVKGVVDREPAYYLGKRRSCDLSEVGKAMEDDFSEMGKLLEQSALPEPERVFSIYHRYDMTKGRCEYTSGFLYDSPQEARQGLVEGQLPAHRALQVDHQGSYRHLGNAWSAAMGCARSKHKTNKAMPMYEVYLNNPHEVAEGDLQVQIYVPVKR